MRNNETREESTSTTRPSSLNSFVRRGASTGYYRTENLPPWSTTSLVGSYFHSGHERGWQGVVVAEVSPGVFLVELFEWVSGTAELQTLVKLEVMLDEGWTFYDNSEWMRNADNSRRAAP